MGRWAARGRWLAQHLCWDGGDPDPRVLQPIFALMLAMALGFRVVGEGPVAVLSWPVGGVVLVSLAGAVVLAAPDSCRRVLAHAAAVLQIAALGMLAHGSRLDIASALVVFPSIWLGLELGRRGVVLAAGATVAFIVVPDLAARGLGLFQVEWVLLMTVLAGFSAFATNAAVVVARTAQADAEAREAELAVALEQLERSRRSAEAVFEAADVGLALLDRDGRPVLMNDRLAELSELAYPGGDLTAAQVFDEHGRTPIAIEDVPTARAQRGEDFDDLRVWIGPERGRRAMSVSARRVEGPDGSTIGAAVAYTDVTDLMRAVKVKEDFVALVSHELRTPLTPIVGYIAVALDRTDLDPVLRKQLDAVARNGRRLERLVQNLLDEIQHDGQVLPLHGRDTDLAELVRECVAGARIEAGRQGVDLVAEIPDSITFRGDPQRLSQVVDNLVSNAIKYTESGGSVEVRATAGSGAVQIVVRDTGIGIPVGDQSRLFDRFYRGAEASRRAIQGIGLGLWITRSIVESHGGRIEVDSEPGRGSEFRVVLPAEAVQIAS